MTADTHPHANQATAETLNHKLVNLGGRQESWMTVNDNPSPADPSSHPPRHQTPVQQTPVQQPKRRGRPPKNPAQPSRAAVPARTPTAHHVERHPASNSTSPQLVNVVAGQNTAESRPASVAVFFSPTPSEDTAFHVPQPIYRGDNTSSVDPDFLQLDPIHAAYAPDTPLETVFMVAAQRQTRLLKRGAEGPPKNAKKRGPVNRLGREQLTIPASAMHASSPSPIMAQVSNAEITRYSLLQPVQSGSPLLRYMPSRSLSLAQSNGQMPSPQLPQAGQFCYPREGQTPLQANNPFCQSAALSRGPVQGRHFTPAKDRLPSINQDIGQHYNPASAPSYTLQDCLQKLNSFHALSPGHLRDKSRLAVLRDATDKQDWAYLTMHQYYCMLSHDPNRVHVALRSHPSLHVALKILYDILGLNEMLSPDVLRFFSNYPFSLEDLGARWPCAFEYQFHLFRWFVTQSPNYDGLKRICGTRRIPPLARELAVGLRIASVTFQQLLFTAFLRCIWRAVP